MRTVYAAAGERFKPVTDTDCLEELRAKYGLPHDPFFLMVARGYASGGSSAQVLYPGKNVTGVLAAYASVKERLAKRIPLVVAGPEIEGRLREDPNMPREHLGGVHFPGQIDHRDMPAL